MKAIKKIKEEAQVNLKAMIDQLTKDIQVTKSLFSDVVIMDGSPAQIYTHLSALKGELDQMNENAQVIQEEIHHRE